MGKLDKYYGQTGGNAAILENKEYVKTDSGKVLKIENAPKHEDKVLKINGRNKKVPFGKGGVVVPNVKSAISSTQERRNSKSKLHTYKDEEIKIMPKEVKAISAALALPVKLQKKAISPAKLLDLLIEKRDNTVKKYKDPIDSRVSPERFSAIKSNQAVLASLPTTENLYDFVFDLQESKKSGRSNQTFAQIGMESSKQEMGQEEQLMQLFQAFADVMQNDEFNTAEEVMMMFQQLSPEEQERFIQQAIQIVKGATVEEEPMVQTGGLPVYQTFNTVKSDNTNYKPQLKSKFLLQQKKDLEEAKNVMNPKAEKAFRDKYGMSSNQFRRKNESGYIKSQASNKNTRDVLRDRSINAEDYVAPNNQFMFPNLSGKAQANMTNQTNDFIAGELAGLGVERLLTKIPKVSSITNDFKSEIDWGKWNKEIPENSQLMQEYNAIEQQAKVNGSWIKNPDGSSFQGTPEQFIQQNSENFKKAFPEGVNSFYRGDRFHRTELNPDTNITFGGERHMADQYTIDNNTFWSSAEHPEGVIVKPKTPTQEPNGGMYELYQKKSKNNVVIDGKGRDWSAIPSDKTFIDKDFLSTDQIAIEMQKRDLDNATIKNIYDGTFNPGDVFINNNKPGNYLKSMRGNNGMFDMTNPNIYKALIPGAIAGASQIENKQQGGKAKLTNYPYMKGSRPALSTSNGKSIEVLDGRTISMDQIYDADSVIVRGNEGKTFYKSKLKKYIK